MQLAEVVPFNGLGEVTEELEEFSGRLITTAAIGLAQFWHRGHSILNLAVPEVQQLNRLRGLAAVRVSFGTIVVEHQLVERRKYRTQVAAAGIVPLAVLISASDYVEFMKLRRERLNFLTQRYDDMVSACGAWRSR